LAYVDGFLFLVTAPVTTFSFRNAFPHSSTVDYISPSPLPMASTLLAGTTLLKTYHRPHYSLYKSRATAPGSLFGILTLEDWATMLCRNVGNKLPILAA
jgi:hypothetical protein